MIDRSKARIRKTGEVFTPLPLVNEILLKLPDSTWDTDNTFIDPACGDGNFLVFVILHKVATGSSVEDASTTTYGIDLMPDNVEMARLRVLFYLWLADDYLQSGPDGREVLRHDLQEITTFTLEHEDMIINDIPEDEWEEFVTQYGGVVDEHIIQGNTLELSFEGDWPPMSKEQRKDALVPVDLPTQ